MLLTCTEIIIEPHIQYDFPYIVGIKGPWLTTDGSAFEASVFCSSGRTTTSH